MRPAQTLLIIAQPQHCDIHAPRHVAACDRNLLVSSGHSFVCMQCGDAAGNGVGALDDQLNVLRRLSNMCRMHPAAMRPNWQLWRDKAAIYTQHTMALLKQMGKPVLSNCTFCHKALHAEAMNPAEHWSAVEVQQCGLLSHTVCLVRWQVNPGISSQCPTCAQQGK